MSSEIIISRESEENSFKNITEFGIDITKYNNKISYDFKYTIFYSENNLFVINNEDKNLVTKNNFTKKIKKLKVYENNFFSFILEDENTSTIIITNFEFIEDNFQIEKPFIIIDYFIFNFLSPLEFYLYINNNGDIHVFRNSEIISENNVFNDSQILRKDFIFDISDIIKIYFSQETQIFLIFLNHGDILSYFLNTENFYINCQENNHINSTSDINFFYSNRNKILLLKDILNLGYPKKLEDIEVNYNNLERLEIISVKTITKEENYQIGNHEKLIYLIIGYNQTNSPNKIKIFKVIKKDFNIIKISIENNQQIFNIPRVKKNEYNQTKDLILYDLFLFNSKIALFHDNSETFPDTIILTMKIKNGINYQIFLANLSDYLKDEINENTNFYFSEFLNFDIFDSIKYLKILGYYFDDFLNEEINFPDNTLNLKFNPVNFNISFRCLQVKEKNQVFLFDEFLNFDTTENLKFNRNDILNLITSDVDRFLENSEKYFLGFSNKKISPENFLFEEENKIESNITKQDVEIFFIEILNKIFKEELFIDKTFDFFNFPLENYLKSGASNKFDLYLAYLIITNEFLSVKYYLSLLDKKKEGYPLISNEKIYFTVEVLYKFLKLEFLEKIKNNFFDKNFFQNRKLVETFQILSKLLYISKNRSEVPIFKPFRLESEIIKENSIEICRLIEEVENHLLIVKIFRNYSEISKKYEELNPRENLEGNYFHLFSSLLIKNLEKKIFPEIKLFFIKYLETINTNRNYIHNNLQLKDLKIILNSSIYFSKFILFLVYVYFIISSEIKNFRFEINLNNEENFINSQKYCNKKFVNLNLFKNEENFYKIIKSKINIILYDFTEEIKEFFDIIFQVYLLDYFSDLKNKKIFYEIKINTNILSDFLIKLNKQNFYFSIISDNKKNFNSNFLNLLLKDERKIDSLVISKNIISFLSDYDEMLYQLRIFLQNDLINLAFQFVNNCFACEYTVSSKLIEDNDLVENEEINYFEKIKINEKFLNMKKLYFEFYEFLIKNKNLEILFSLPLNMIERYMLKELILSDTRLEHLIILYYMKIKKYKNVEINFELINKSENFSEINIKIYSYCIKVMEYIFCDKENFPDKTNKIERNCENIISHTEDYKLWLNVYESESNLENFRNKEKKINLKDDPVKINYNNLINNPQGKFIILIIFK